MGDLPKMVSDPPDPGLPLPSVPFLGGKGVQGQEGQCHLGLSPQTSGPGWEIEDATHLCSLPLCSARGRRERTSPGPQGCPRPAEGDDHNRS